MLGGSSASGTFTGKSSLDHQRAPQNLKASCPFHKLELYEISELGVRVFGLDARERGQDSI